MISNRTEHVFMKQLVDMWIVCPNDRGSVTTTLTLSEFNLPRKVGRDELLQKCKAQGLITYTILYDKIDIRLTELGKTYLEHQAEIRRQEHKSDRRYRITTGIAVAALITSIVAIILSVVLR